MLKRFSNYVVEFQKERKEKNITKNIWRGTGYTFFQTNERYQGLWIVNVIPRHKKYVLCISIYMRQS